METCWQLDDDAPELETGELPPELKLVAAVIRKARSDLRSTNLQHRNEAQAFFRGYRGSFAMWCDMAGIEPEVIRRLVAP